MWKRGNNVLIICGMLVILWIVLYECKSMNLLEGISYSESWYENHWNEYLSSHSLNESRWNEYVNTLSLTDKQNLLPLPQDGVDYYEDLTNYDRAKISGGFRVIALDDDDLKKYDFPTNRQGSYVICHRLDTPHTNIEEDYVRLMDKINDAWKQYRDEWIKTITEGEYSLERLEWIVWGNTNPTYINGVRGYDATISSNGEAYRYQYLREKLKNGFFEEKLLSLQEYTNENKYQIFNYEYVYEKRRITYLYVPYKITPKENNSLEYWDRTRYMAIDFIDILNDFANWLSTPPKNSWIKPTEPPEQERIQLNLSQDSCLKQNKRDLTEQECQNWFNENEGKLFTLNDIESPYSSRAWGTKENMKEIILRYNTDTIKYFDAPYGCFFRYNQYYFNQHDILQGGSVNWNDFREHGVIDWDRYNKAFRNTDNIYDDFNNNLEQKIENHKDRIIDYMYPLCGDGPRPPPAPTLHHLIVMIWMMKQYEFFVKYFIHLKLNINHLVILRLKVTMKIGV